ncbi:hypothetical protein [Candidatus Pantoea soli]|uniref:Secreted protein n=1 Tax=Candidatus Pantoea soli TaxID=3098669 RepID=A0A518XHN5_9GAMM|nr:hypothetical protein [Pantoea soli]QDY43725.1 hypothetical protein D8B20_16375 [Pantoea soli]
MKALLIALFGLSLSASALADDNDADAQENVYASQLCHIVSGEQKTGDMQSYTEKMKSQLAASQSPSAMNKPSFDEETAQEVVNGWLELGEEERAKLRHNQQQCEQTVMTQFQQQD